MGDTDLGVGEASDQLQFAKVHELEKQVWAERERADAMERSLSWRLTRPLRTVRRFGRATTERSTRTRDLSPVLESAKPLSMASEADIRFTAERALDAIDRGVPGVLVECGVWRGGCSVAMLLAQRERYGTVERKTYLLDSFEGLPPATERDGPAAIAWQADPDGPSYYDNCTASLEDVGDALTALGLPPGSWELVPGWFEETVPALSVRLRSDGIALLRLDADWYDSTIVCLENLVPLVADEGMVIIDDYYAYDGCARATHEYLARHDHSYRIRGIPGGSGAYFVKRPHRVGPARL